MWPSRGRCAPSRGPFSTTNQRLVSIRCSTALSIDEEIIKLRDLDEVSSVVVTHQLRDAFYIALHEAVRRGGDLKYGQASDAKAAENRIPLVERRARTFEGAAAELKASTNPYIRAFLS